MKIAILGITNIKHMTLISIYTTLLRQYHIEYDLIYIDKYNIDEKNNANTVYKYCSYGETNTVIGKIKHTIKFWKFATQIIKHNKYDFVIVWREQTAAIFATFLKKYYKNRYCVNIRDLWDNNNFIMTLGVKCALKHSYFNTVSSKDFCDYLPFSQNIIFVESVNKEIISLFKNKAVHHIKEKQPIIIKSIGVYRNDQYFQNFVNALKNDNRFEIHFIGQGSSRMEQFCKEHEIFNVKCYGSFSPEEIGIYLTDADIINCSSGRENIAEETKIPIRFYYAVYNYLPIITNKGTSMSAIGEKLNNNIDIPAEINPIDKLGDYIYKQYMNINYASIQISINDYLTHIEDGQMEIERKLVSLFNQK